MTQSSLLHETKEVNISSIYTSTMKDKSMFVTITQFTEKPQETPQEKFPADRVHRYTLKRMQASFYRAGRTLCGAQFVLWGEWNSACYFAQTAQGSLYWLKRRVPVPRG